MENPKISLRGQGFGHKRPIRRWGPYSPPVFGGPQALDLQPARVAHIRRPAFTPLHRLTAKLLAHDGI